MASEDVTLRINVEIKEATKAIQSFANTTEKQLKEVAGNTSFGTQLGANLVAGLLESGISNALSFVKESATALFDTFVVDGIKAAAVTQDAFNQLKISLESTGISSQAALEDFDKFVDGIEKGSKFSGDAVFEAAAKIQQIGRVSAEELKKGTQAAVDLAAALGIDLNAATLLVAKAAEGNVSAFQRYGIQIRAAGTAAETFSRTVDTLNSRFGGAAAKQLDTYSGALAQAKVQFEDIQKAIGGLIINSPAVIGAIKGISQVFNLISSTIKGTFEGNADPLRPLILSTIEFTRYMVNTLPVFLQFGDVGVTVVGALTKLFIELGQAVTETALPLDRLANKIGLESDETLKGAEKLSAFFHETLPGAIDSASSAIAGLREKFGSDKITSVLLQSLDTIQASVINTTNVAGEHVKRTIDKIFKDVSGQTIEIGIKVGDPLAIAAQQDVINNQILAAAEQLRVSKATQDQLQAEADRQSALTNRELTEQELLAKDQLFKEIQLQAQLDFEQKLLDAQTTAALNKDIFEKSNETAKLLFQKSILDQRLALVAKGSADEQAIKIKAKQLDDLLLKQRLQQTQTFFGDLSSLMQTKNKDLFAIGKAAALANAIVGGFLAVQNALSVPPFPVGLALAAAAAVKAAVQISGIQSQNLATGITAVPAGFPNDSFPANLTSGERVLSVAQNQDLSRFISNQESKEQQGSSSVGELKGVLDAILNRLGNLENTTIVNIGSREIVREVREGLRSGQVLTT